MRIPPLLLLGAVCLGCQAEPGPFTDEARREVDAQVRAASGALLEAMNAGDSPGVLSFYRDDPSFFYLGCTDYILGSETFRRVVAPVYRTDAPVTFDLGVVATQVLTPDVAVVSLRGSSSNAPSLFFTQVWVQEAGAWKVSAEHESWPGCRESQGPHPFTGAAEDASLRPDGPGD
ncbi:MAG TPA: nuclear transport factor 2 family protein [Longimicrobiales bacterium]|nr:nuclear transport factor 2 family protein [Longimicrobiales bacterium]